jgi:hypothetical protein
MTSKKPSKPAGQFRQDSERRSVAIGGMDLPGMAL